MEHLFTIAITYFYVILQQRNNLCEKHLALELLYWVVWHGARVRRCRRPLWSAERDLPISRPKARESGNNGHQLGL